MLRVLLGLAGAGVVTGLYAVLVERNWYALRRHTIPCLPPGSEPLRILHLSDLHLRAVQRRKQRWLRGLARLEPDLVVGTGDFLGDPTPQTAEATTDTVTAIPARLGGLFVTGSNDFFSPVPKNPLRYLIRRRAPKVHGPQNEWQRMLDGLVARGWQHIDNRTTKVDGIEVAGIGDAHIGLADSAIAIERDGEGFRLGVTHSPDAAEELADKGYDLILCGHTHGGQVCLPFYGAIVTNCRLPREMARGVHPMGTAWLHVCAGLGTSMYAPFRFACRPEACLLELVPRA